MSINSGQTSGSFPEKVTMAFISVILLLVLMGVGYKAIVVSAEDPEFPQADRGQADYNHYEEIDRHFSWSFHMALTER